MIARASIPGRCAERLCGADRVYSAKGATQHQQVVHIVEFRRVTAAAWEQGIEKPGPAMHGLAAIVDQRRYYRDLGLEQFGAEGVFLVQLFLVPAPGR
jgi:hypothetical protein